LQPHGRCGVRPGSRGAQRWGCHRSRRCPHTWMRCRSFGMAFRRSGSNAMAGAPGRWSLLALRRVVRRWSRRRRLPPRLVSPRRAWNSSRAGRQAPSWGVAIRISGADSNGPARARRRTRRRQDGPRVAGVGHSSSVRAKGDRRPGIGQTVPLMRNAALLGPAIRRRQAPQAGGRDRRPVE